MLTSTVDAKTIWVEQDKPQQLFEVSNVADISIALRFRSCERVWPIAYYNYKTNKYLVHFDQADVHPVDMASFLIYLRKCLIQYQSLFEYSEVAIDMVINRYLDECEGYRNAF